MTDKRVANGYSDVLITKWRSDELACDALLALTVAVKYNGERISADREPGVPNRPLCSSAGPFKQKEENYLGKARATGVVMGFERAE